MTFAAASRTLPVRRDRGQQGHTLKGCVLSCPPARSHGLAGQHGTLSLMSPLSPLSRWWQGFHAIALLIPSHGRISIPPHRCQMARWRFWQRRWCDFRRRTVTQSPDRTDSPAGMPLGVRNGHPPNCADCVAICSLERKTYGSKLRSKGVFARVSNHVFHTVEAVELRDPRRNAQAWRNAWPIIVQKTPAGMPWGGKSRRRPIRDVPPPHTASNPNLSASRCIAFQLRTGVG